MDMPRQARRTTIYDLAELLGTSPSAVSAVLNGTWQKRRISAALAGRVRDAAAAEGYAPNLQASGLRRENSRMIGMILPKYDNRYFGAIAERFEAMSRERGLFPVITCTQRDAALEIEATRSMVAHRVTCLVATGATDPDAIAELCAASGVRTLNLDLPGRRAPSVISDNHAGALALARLIFAGGPRASLLFVGGRPHDHNTQERVRGFRDAHAELGLPVADEDVLLCGYAADKAERALEARTPMQTPMPAGIFVNSTIALEGVVRWAQRRRAAGLRRVRLGCFDYDAFAACLEETVAMVRQDIDALLEALFRLVDTAAPASVPPPLIEVPPVLCPSARPPAPSVAS